MVIRPLLLLLLLLLSTVRAVYQLSAVITLTESKRGREGDASACTQTDSRDKFNVCAADQHTSTASLKSACVCVCVQHAGGFLFASWPETRWVCVFQAPVIIHHKHHTCRSHETVLIWCFLWIYFTQILLSLFFFLSSISCCWEKQKSSGIHPQFDSGTACILSLFPLCSCLSRRTNKPIRHKKSQESVLATGVIFCKLGVKKQLCWH